MNPMKDAAHFYEVERREFHAQRPGFRINELQDPKESVTLERGDTYCVPPRRPHLVTNAGDASATFLVLQGVGEHDFVPLLAPKESR